MSTVVWGFLGGVVLGFILEEVRDRWLWRKAMRALAVGPMSTTPPTTTELHRPSWMEDA